MELVIPASCGWCAAERSANPFRSVTLLDSMRIPCAGSVRSSPQLRHSKSRPLSPSCCRRGSPSLRLCLLSPRFLGDTAPSCFPGGSP
eukprot:5503873-Karenia_brevis.AAC.1